MSNDSGKKPLTEEFFLDIITKWKFAWMDVQGTDEKDRANYHGRAFRIDANMKYSLARMLEKACEPTPCANCERLEGGKLQWEPQWKSNAEANAAGYNQALEEIQRLQKQLDLCKEALGFLND